VAVRRQIPAPAPRTGAGEGAGTGGGAGPGARSCVARGGIAIVARTETRGVMETAEGGGSRLLTH